MVLFGQSYGSKGFYINKFKKYTKVLIVDSNEQLKNLPQQKNNLNCLYYSLDFEKLSKEFDAIEVFISKDRELGGIVILLLL